MAVGVPISQTIYIQGGIGPFTITRTGWLDPGLRISGSNNNQYTQIYAPINPPKDHFFGMTVQTFLLDGTPTGTGPSRLIPNFRFTVTDSIGAISNATGSLVGSSIKP